MMRVLLINIDSKIPNLALKKIEKYHKDRGDEVVWDFPLYPADKTYVSVIFTWNRDKVKQLCLPGEVEIGGTGWDIYKTLPPEIDKVKPRINIGFITRGCIRRCPFCIVWEKESEFKQVATIYDIWDGRSKDIILLDNNILAMRKVFFQTIADIKKEGIRVDFNQGLDCRLLDDEIVKALKSIKHKEYRFAFDTMEIKPQVIKAIKLLQKYGINRCTWYVLVGFNTTFQEDLERLNLLREMNQNAYVQRYNGYQVGREYIPLARWANQHHIFQKMTWQQFINHPANKKYKKELLEKGIKW